jgi:amino acid transporter
MRANYGNMAGLRRPRGGRYVVGAMETGSVSKSADRLTADHRSASSARTRCSGQPHRHHGVHELLEVFGTQHYGTPLNEIALPLTALVQIYDVTFFKIPVDLGAMVSFVSLTLSCLNAGSRMIYPMAEHTIFPKHLGRAHRENQKPHVPITVYIAVILAIPMVLEIFTNPLTTFGDVGTLAAFGS